MCAIDCRMQVSFKCIKQVYLALYSWSTVQHSFPVAWDIRVEEAAVLLLLGGNNFGRYLELLLSLFYYLYITYS